MIFCLPRRYIFLLKICQIAITRRKSHFEPLLHRQCDSSKNRGKKLQEIERIEFLVARVGCEATLRLHFYTDYATSLISKW